MTAKTRVLFAGHDLKFLRLFLERCRGNEALEVMVDEHPTYEVEDPARSSDLLRRADVVFCEWCLGNAAWYSKHLRAGQRLVVRFHRHEITTPYPFRVEWEKVDRIIFISPQVRDDFLLRFPTLRERSELIYNTVDCRSFDLPKLADAEFSLGLLGFIPRLKAPDLALEVLAALKRVDSRYLLFIKGKQPWEYDWVAKTPEEASYYRDFFSRLEQSSLRNSVIFDPHGDDVAQWFRKIGFVLSTSTVEGSHQAVAEGMASGAIPVIRDWKGSRRMYPERYVFSAAEQAAALIRQWHSPGRYEEESAFSKGYARDLFDAAAVAAALERVLLRR